MTTHGADAPDVKYHGRWSSFTVPNDFEKLE
jgi:hypothetical protein